MIKMKKKKKIYKEVLVNLFNTNLNDPPKNILGAVAAMISDLQLLETRFIKTSTLEFSWPNNTEVIILALFFDGSQLSSQI